MIAFDPFLAGVFCVTTLLVGLILVYTPKLSSPGVRLGVRVPETHWGDDVVRRQEGTFLKRQVAATVVSALLAIPAAVVPVVGAVLTLVPVGFFMWNLNQAGQPIREAKQREGWFDGVRTVVAGEIMPVEDTSPQRAWAFTWAALAVLAVAAGYVAARWGDIPERFATHFGSGFEPDSWDNKSVGSVFFPTFFGVGMVLLFALITVVLLRVSVPARADTSLRGKVSQKIIRRHTAMWLAVMNVALAIMFASLQVVTVLHTDWVAPAMIGSLVLVFAVCLAMVVALARKQSALANTSGEGRDNDERYKWGMFYYNPDDPAVLVDKRVGVGLDFNYAHWQGKAFLAFIALVLLASILLPFLL